jgi:hypothetical protein
MPDWDALDPHVRQLIAEGLTDTEIAQRFGLKRQTLVDHLRKQRMRDQVSSPRAAVEMLSGQSGLDAADTPAYVSEEVAMSTVVDIVPVNGSREALSRAEAQRLEDYEQIIAEGIQTFVQVGHALLAIRDQRLYRQDYGTFEEYLRQRWDLGRSYAHRMIDAAVVVENLLPIGNIVPANEDR